MATASIIAASIASTVGSAPLTDHIRACLSASSSLCFIPARSRYCAITLAANGSAVRWTPKLSTRRQCKLLGLPRSTHYDMPKADPGENLRLMRVIRPDVHCVPVLRLAPDDALAGAAGPQGEPQTRAPADAVHGPGDDLSAAADDDAKRGASGVSVPPAQRGGRSAEPGVGDRHHLRAEATPTCMR